MEFSTFDADNDKWFRNCAAKRGGGFWSDECGFQNINAIYGGYNYNNIWWGNYENLKKTQLMIRPAADN